MSVRPCNYFASHFLVLALCNYMADVSSRADLIERLDYHVFVSFFIIYIYFIYIYIHLFLFYFIYFIIFFYNVVSLVKKKSIHNSCR